MKTGTNRQLGLRVLTLVACLSGSFWPVAQTSLFELFDTKGTTSVMNVNGVSYGYSSLAFPTGRLESSGLLLEKISPVKLRSGSRFAYEVRVSNLLDSPLQKVSVVDWISRGLDEQALSPPPKTVSGNQAQWEFDELAPGDSQVIRVGGLVAEAGIVLSCGTASYTPVLCRPIEFVEAGLAIDLAVPESASSCDPIPVTMTVRNSGSSELTGVTVSGTLPDGVSRTDGRTDLAFQVGRLEVGETKTIRTGLLAGELPRIELMVNGRSAEGVSASAVGSTRVVRTSVDLECLASERILIGRPAKLCFQVRNSGDEDASNLRLRVAIPDKARVSRASLGGRLSGGYVFWDIPVLPAGAVQDYCLVSSFGQVGTMDMRASLTGGCDEPIVAACPIIVNGIPAILLEVVDLEDPIEVGAVETYQVRVTNQGSAPATNVTIVCELEESQAFVSGSGQTEVTASGQTVRMQPVPSITPKAQATWLVKVKAVEPGDVRFAVKMTADQITRPVDETEATNQY